MNESIIISKMNGFMFELKEVIGDWLESKLPDITPGWWDELVINNLNDSQLDKVKTKGIRELKELDLETLLRILDRNWFVITGSFFIDNKERVNVHKMQEVRNTWAFIIENDITKERIIDDVETIKILLKLFGASIPVLRELEEFIIAVSAANNIKKDQINSVIEKPIEATDNSINQNITVGKPVCLVSDESIVGAVTEINGNNYKVLIGGEFKNFYKEQIKLHKPKSCDNAVSLNRLKSSMTAYQIYNPGSSNLYSLNAARIDFVPYQFRPALKIIKSESSRILVADDVGVGKTIEAGLILKELEARSSINSVLIICPRPLVAERKWEMEMKRFDENFSQLDGRAFLQAISDTDRDGEWPERHSKTIMPYSLFSETNINGGNGKSGSRRRNIGLEELDPLPRFDLVIVDEAHHIRNPKTWQYKGVELFCRNADAVVFLTATPLQNSDNDLYTLLNLLRPDVVLDKETFKMMSEPNRNINNLLGIIRRQADGWQQEAKAEITEVLATSWGRNVIQHNPNFAKIYDYIEKPLITREEKIET
ncbi:MAG: DEAD/DEAH box helicase family protein, partial [Candidatus Cloacimonetes bacterium]|nr:DEAD/DEAH box helicase family protein [Candidatus Cloacimonadota bacterium]MDY0230836.1 SNF2-related protein [Candidatus Cloacimonadaceae bacterium]